jgi:type IV pilus assembly protein PilV
MRTQATILAYDMIDSMRANIPAVTNGNYRLTFAAATPAAVNCYGSAANCASGDMAVSDINRWRTVLANYLPSGNGQITTVLNATTTQVSVSVQWLDPLTAERGNEQVSLLAVLRQ